MHVRLLQSIQNTSVTLCNSIRHVSSHSREVGRNNFQTAILCLLCFTGRQHQPRLGDTVIEHTSTVTILTQLKQNRLRHTDKVVAR